MPGYGSSYWWTSEGLSWSHKLFLLFPSLVCLFPKWSEAICIQWTNSLIFELILKCVSFLAFGAPQSAAHKLTPPLWGLHWEIFKDMGCQGLLSLICQVLFPFLWDGVRKFLNACSPAVSPQDLTAFCTAQTSQCSFIEKIFNIWYFSLYRG